MKTSTDRILVTLVGSLPRSQAVTDVLFARERGESLDESAARATIADAVADAVRRQVARLVHTTGVWLKKASPRTAGRRGEAGGADPTRGV